MRLQPAPQPAPQPGGGKRIATGAALGGAALGAAGAVTGHRAGTALTKNKQFMSQVARGAGDTARKRGLGGASTALHTQRVTGAVKKWMPRAGALGRGAAMGAVGLAGGAALGAAYHRLRGGQTQASFDHIALGFFDQEKIASGIDTSPIEDEDKESRKRRLAELLKKREHSGTASGSASPTPPRG